MRAPTAYAGVGARLFTCEVSARSPLSERGWWVMNPPSSPSGWPFAVKARAPIRRLDREIGDHRRQRHQHRRCAPPPSPYDPVTASRPQPALAMSCRSRSTAKSAKASMSNLAPSLARSSNPTSPRRCRSSRSQSCCRATQCSPEEVEDLDPIRQAACLLEVRDIADHRVPHHRLHP